MNKILRDGHGMHDVFLVLVLMLLSLDSAFASFVGHICSLLSLNTYFIGVGLLVFPHLSLHIYIC